VFEWGVGFNDPSIDINRLRNWKEKIISKMSEGLVALCKKRGVNFVNGQGSFENSNTMKISDGDSIAFERCIIATGSQPIMPSQFLRANSCVMDSTAALSLSDIPEKLLVVGGGYIGLEMGSIWSRLGSSVTVLEYLDFITPGMDREVSNEFQKILTKQGIKFKLNNKVTSVQNVSNKVVVNFTNNKTHEREKKECDKVLVAVGRKPYTEGLNLSKLGIKKDTQGKIEVNKKLQTSINNIYAIGDVIKGPMLAHKAEEEGIAVAEIIAGQAGHVNYDVIPGVVYTSPEVATVCQYLNKSICFIVYFSS
jgi:dihydrolipoamide dehydrogenase